MYFKYVFWVTSYEVYGPVASKLSWIDLSNFVAIKLKTRLFYFTKLSVKWLNIFFLSGTHHKLQHKDTK